ncbi:MAG TPA: phosphoenolpyruvate synthase [Caldilineae bacterium]|nr:phosphoenolpyruvate synthase [Caldilineae bacterium]
MPPTILPLASPHATLATVGGKGLNLVRLARAGFPVPPGFLIPTDAYRAFVAANALQAFILDALAASQLDDPDALQAASAAIRARFATGAVPTDLVEALTAAYADLGHPAVAVRSSAIAEDLPDMSFAGQQDTFLNVVGDEALLEAVVKCWSSLWTARAIAYRARNDIPQDEMAQAVVVQEMVQSEASGVLFTANPLTGKRTETVIDATLGLGEALVAGLVEPDHYVVDTTAGRIISKEVGAKALVILSNDGGGVSQMAGPEESHQALPDAVILQLAQLGQAVAAHYDGEPQDIEWAWTDGELHLLQSRPITSLFPLPPGLGPEPLQIMFAFSSVQGIMEPITPLGQDVLLLFFSALARIFQPHTAPENQGVALIAAERIWLNFTGLFRHKMGRKIALGFMDFIEPSVRQIMGSLVDDPRLAIVPRRIRFITWLRLLRFMAGIVAGTLYSIARPDAARRSTQRDLQQLVAQAEGLFAEATDLSQQVQTLHDYLLTTPVDFFPAILPRIAAGMSMLNALMHLARTVPEGEQLALEITRGLPHNVTTEMDLALWDAAQAIRSDAEAWAAFQQQDAESLASAYLAETLPPVAQDALADFLARYGMRGFGEIDFGRPRWCENPTPVMQSLQSYLRIEDPQKAPDVVFRQGALAADQALDRLAEGVRHTPRGRIKARLARFAARRVRALSGLREAPKFFIIRIMGISRAALLESGEKLTRSGILQDPTDLFYLHLDELQALGAGEQRDWQALVAAHRARYRQEMRRQQVPRLLLSDGVAYYEGMNVEDSGDANINDAGIVGSPVSPGVVEGVVHVVFDPHDAQLTPGEILICPGTDPSWTPLFLAAGGLVMEVGGMMTHGSVVAREYGIPAVVGVHQATTRLQTGQRIRVNGSTGEITLLESHPANEVYQTPI